MIKIFILTALLFIGAVITFDCKSKSNGLYPHETDKHKFYECSNGRAEELNCTESLIFDEKVKACVWDHSAENGTTESGVRTSPRPTGTPRLTTKIPFDCPTKEGLFPHKTNKHKFYECSNGKPEEITCPEQLIFDAKTKQCVWNNNGWTETSTNKPTSTKPQSTKGHTIIPTRATTKGHTIIPTRATTKGHTIVPTRATTKGHTIIPTRATTKGHTIVPTRATTKGHTIVPTKRPVTASNTKVTDAPEMSPRIRHMTIYK